MAATLRTASDVRDHLMREWRDVLPELLVPQVRVGLADEDDGLIEIRLDESLAGPVARLLVLPVASGEPRLLRALLGRLRDLASAADTVGCFGVPYMARAGAKLCRESGIGFVDCCGNANLKFNAVVCQVSGNRNRFAESKRPRTLFHDKATIPLRILLGRPDAWATTREIADEGGLSLGWVSQILQRLDDQGYVERKRGGGTRIVEPERLLDDWLREYAFEQNEVYPFRIGGGVDAGLERLRCLQPPLDRRYALTLDAAVATLSREPETSALHLYLADAVQNEQMALEMWQEALDLRPAGHGADCFLVRPTYAHAAFFDLGDRAGLRVVSDLQLYLDLFHYPAAHRRQVRAQVAERLPFTVD